jgi:hypothetical protein
MESEVLSNIFVFVLAGFVGFEVIKRVSPTAVQNNLPFSILPASILGMRRL